MAIPLYVASVRGGGKTEVATRSAARLAARDTTVPNTLSVESAVRVAEMIGARQ
jgi:hypothetical protein